MKKLLLVGATGFLGQHLEKTYQAQGWTVRTLGRSVHCDYIFDPQNLESLLELEFGEKFDRIIHAAAINEVDINKNITDTYSVNVTLTRYLIELSKRIAIDEFVYISTFHVYGRSGGAISNDTACEPKNDYGLTHYLSEVIVRTLGLTFGIKTLIVRPTNIYGLPVDIVSFKRWSLVPFSFVRSAVLDGSIKILSSGMQSRNFVSVEDVVRSTELVGRVSIVNAYGLDTLSIRNFALLIAELIKASLSRECLVSWKDVDVADEQSELKVQNGFKGYSPQNGLKNYINDFLMVLAK